MGIALDAETEKFARRLADLRGESVEEAVKTAVRAELARIEQVAPESLTTEQQTKVKKMLAIVRSLPPLNIPEGDPTSFLYDDLGLPH